MNSETYYTILGCEESATLEEIKRNYQQLIKCNHPDKNSRVSSDKFIQINEAWNTLRDSNLRAQYDASLLHKSLHESPLVYAEINVNDLKFTDSTAHYTCRCGHNISIDRDDLSTEEILFECAECSNCIIVFNNKYNK